MSFTDYTLLQTQSRGFNEARLATSVIRRTINEDERLLLTQPTDRDDLDDDDCVVLDRDTQHALYLLLKNRFE